MTDYDNGPWRNRHRQPYEQYCYEDELPEKLQIIFKLYGAAFDDDWTYFRVRHRKHQRQVIARRPHWMSRTTGGWYLDGKHRRRDENQQKLS